MKKRHVFRPTGVDVLEEKVVLAHGISAAAVPGQVFFVSAKQANAVINRIHADYAAAMSGYRTAYLQAVRQARFIGEAAALQQLGNRAIQGEQVLEQALLRDSALLPFGAQNLFPALQADAQGTLANLLSSTSLAEAGRFAGSDIRNGYRASKADTIAYVQFINQGGLG